jgi:hypothetical protein
MNDQKVFVEVQQWHAVDHQYSRAKIQFHSKKAAGFKNQDRVSHLPILLEAFGWCSGTQHNLWMDLTSRCRD